MEKNNFNQQKVNKHYKRIELELQRGKNKLNNFTIVFFHGTNHATHKYNYTFVDGVKVRKNYFLDKLGSIANLFLYDRPEEMLRFNYEQGKSNCQVNYTGNTIETHVKNLYKFLSNEKVEGPYVLVSHSIGSLYALKFSQLYPKETKHVFLIDPIQFTSKIAKMYFNSKKLSESEIADHLEVINSPKSKKVTVEKSLDALDSTTYSIPYFKPIIKCPLTTFFNVNTTDYTHDNLTVPYITELEKYNPTMTNYYFYDRDHYLNETNPQGIVTKIKKELQIT